MSGFFPKTPRAKDILKARITRSARHQWFLEVEFKDGTATFRNFPSWTEAMAALNEMGTKAMEAAAA